MLGFVKFLAMGSSVFPFRREEVLDVDCFITCCLLFDNILQCSICFSVPYSNVYDSFFDFVAVKILMPESQRQDCHDMLSLI